LAIYQELYGEIVQKEGETEEQAEEETKEEVKTKKEKKLKKDKNKKRVFDGKCDVRVLRLKRGGDKMSVQIYGLDGYEFSLKDLASFLGK